MLGFAAVTPSDTRVAAVTVRFVDPDVAPSIAVIVVEPGVTVVANPFDPATSRADRAALGMLRKIDRRAWCFAELERREREVTP